MIELHPDKRHLTGGLVAALLLTAWMVYAGVNDPGGVYYKPDYSAHTGNKYDEVSCTSCHVAFKAASAAEADQKCLDCHYKLAQALQLPASRQVIPAITASAKLHALIGSDASCSQCHVEHAKTDLTELLRLPPEERKSQARFFPLIHDTIPKAYQGPDNCVLCHLPAEIEGK